MDIYSPGKQKTCATLQFIKVNTYKLWILNKVLPNHQKHLQNQSNRRTCCYYSSPFKSIAPLHGPGDRNKRTTAYKFQDKLDESIYRHSKTTQQTRDVTLRFIHHRTSKTELQKLEPTKRGTIQPRNRKRELINYRSSDSDSSSQQNADRERRGGHVANEIPFLTVSISAPARRAALTAFSSFLAAAFGAFLRMTTGSQSCEIGPTPAISLSPSLSLCFLSLRMDNCAILMRSRPPPCEMVVYIGRGEAAVSGLASLLTEPCREVCWSLDRRLLNLVRS